MSSIFPAGLPEEARSESCGLRGEHKRLKQTL